MDVQQKVKHQTMLARTQIIRSSLVQKRGLLTETGLAAIAGSALTAGVLSYRYKIAQPDEYVVKTGLGIKDISVSKTTFQWPFQTYKMIKMEPRNYTFELNAVTKDYVQFILPVVFTIGPKDDPDALIRYVRRLEHMHDRNEGTNQMDAIILGILEGDVRTQCGLLEIEEIFNDRQKFKEVIIERVQEELDKVGLLIISANIKELQDNRESNYFHNRSQKKQSETANRAKIDIAEATKLGNIGQKEREAATRQAVVQYEAETVMRENERTQEIERSTAQLEVIKAEALKTKQIAHIESDNASKIRETELQQELEQKRILMETEKRRATELSKAQVLAEVKIKESEGIAQALKVQADATLYAKQREADGIFAVLKAQSDGIHSLTEAMGNDHQALLKYLMIEKGVYKELAEANAQAIHGLKPQISIWTTGGSEDSSAKIMADVMKMVPPLVSTIEKQTGLTPLDWLSKKSQ